MIFARSRGLYFVTFRTTGDYKSRKDKGKTGGIFNESGETLPHRSQLDKEEIGILTLDLTDSLLYDGVEWLLLC